MEEKKEQMGEQNKGETNTMKKIVIVAIALLVLGGAGYWAVTSSTVDLTNLGIGSSKELVAKVNGEGIEKRIFEIRFEQTKGAYQAQGIPFEEAQLRERVLVDMIDERLLIQHAKDQGITADEQVVEQEYQQIVSQFETEEQFQQQVDAQGATIEDVKISIADQIIIRQLVDQRVSETVIEVLPEEIQQAYDEVVASGTEVPPFEEVQPQIEESIRQQKITQMMEALVEQLRIEGSVEILS